MATKSKSSKTEKKTSKPKAAGKATNGRTEAKAKKGEVRAGSKLELIVGLLKRPDGCTTADVLKATGWPAVSMPQQARSAGLTLKKEKVDGVTRYSAA